MLKYKYRLQVDRQEQSSLANMKHKVSLLAICFDGFFWFFCYPEAACIWFMHIRHRCRNSPRLIRGFSAFPAVVPAGYLLQCFTSHYLGQEFWNAAPVQWTPHSEPAPSVLCSFSFCSYGVIRSCAGWKLGPQKGFRAMKATFKVAFYFIFMEWKSKGRGRKVSILVSLEVCFQRDNFQGLRSLFVFADWINSGLYSYLKL